ncbi:MAG: hypothetical protein A2V79_01400 [Betaproteobacteria bacterium RBG_16_56_24]|nr:MAG: hypothetical protein A2V79_01400 [Betaproteobacteria bacterium RBG_16_56_24]
MKQLIIQFRAQLGWQGMTGIALLVLAGAFQVLALKPLEQQVTFMSSHLAAARAKTSKQGINLNLGDRQQELGAFFDSLPVEKDVTDILASIYTIAEASGVGLTQAEYHPDSNAQPRVEYGMAFPVRGEYANIRYFVLRVLADHPAIALDQLRFQRDKISNPMLKAEIRFTLFLRRER